MRTIAPRPAAVTIETCPFFAAESRQKEARRAAVRPTARIERPAGGGAANPSGVAAV